jgi:hypothetical protein
MALKHRASFDIQTPNDFFTEVVLQQYQEFLEDNASTRKALIAIIVAYHMYDWVYKTGFCSKRSHFQPNITTVFETAREITNGTKHFEPKTNTKRRINTKKQAGFSSGFSDGFTRPLIIIRDDKTEISADELLRTMIEAWKQEKADSKF